MAERRQPDYDFFGPGQGAAQPPTGQPPAGQPPYGQTQYGTQSQFGTQPAHGTPPPPSFAPPPAPHAAWQQGRPPYPVPPRSRAVTALIAAAAVVVALVAVGIVSAVAIPVFLAQRMKAEWRSTTLTLPATFDGGERDSIPRDLIPKDLSDQAETVEMASYRTSSGTTLFVTAAKSKVPLSSESQVQERRGLVSGMADVGVQATFTEADPGKLGGWFGCGTPSNDQGSVCVATDHAGIVMVILRDSQDPVADARRMREAVVHR